MLLNFSAAAEKLQLKGNILNLSSRCAEAVFNFPLRENDLCWLPICQVVTAAPNERAFVLLLVQATMSDDVRR